MVDIKELKETISQQNKKLENQVRIIFLFQKMWFTLSIMSQGFSKTFCQFYSF